MKYAKGLFGVVLLVLAVCAGVSASAVNSGFSTKNLAEKDKNTFLSNINMSLLKEEPAKRAVVCFDINKNGLIAVGQNGSDGKAAVCVYSDEGVFQYGYKFNSSGSIGVEWNETNLNIFFARSDVIAEVNPSAQVVSIAQVEDTVENNTYLNRFIRSTERTVGDTVYTLNNDMGIFNWFASDYSQLTVSKPTGETKILYDVNSTQLIKKVTVLLVVLLVGVTTVLAVRQSVEQNMKKCK